MGKKVIVFLFLLTSFLGKSQVESSKMKAPELMQLVLDSLASKYPDLINFPERYRFKIVFTEVQRKNGKVALETVSYRSELKEYLYPASIVKLPTVLITMEEFNKIKSTVPNLDFKNTVKFVKDRGCLPTMNQIKIGNRMYPSSLDVLTKQVLAVSDNDAYNRLFDFCGQQTLNRRMKELNFNQGKIIRKFVLNCTLDQNRISDSLVMFGKRNERLYTRGTISNRDTIYLDTSYKLGLSYEGFNKQLVNRPFDFSKQNNLDLVDVHKILTGLVFPKSSKSHQFNITNEQRNYLLQNLARYPNEYGLAYNSLEYFPTYKKYLFFGRDSKLNYLSDTLTRFRSFNVVGVSFGCVIDASYLVDFETGKEFFLTAGLYANQDEVINDAKYDYETLAYPLLKDLGRLFMNNISENKDAIDYLKAFGKELELIK